MSYTFITKPEATIRAKITGTDGYVSVQGTNPTSTPENAKAQIDKILALTGSRTIDVSGMTRTRTEEVVSND